MGDIIERSELTERFRVLSKDLWADLSVDHSGRRFYESFSDYVRRVPRAPQ